MSNLYEKDYNKTEYHFRTKSIKKIDANRAREAAAAAKEAMLQKKSIREFHAAQMTLARAATRLKVKGSINQ